MNVRHIDDLETPIRDIRQAAGAEGIVLESAKETRFAVLPLDDDRIDYLLERDPRLSEVCGEIRKRMNAGRIHSRADVREALGNERGAADAGI